MMVLFYWQLDSKLAGMFEYKPQLWDHGASMPSVKSFAPYVTTCVPFGEKND